MLNFLADELTNFIAPLGFFILFKTSLGLIIRSTGENPEAVEVAGLKVEKIRFLVTLVAGFMGAKAGSFYSIVYLGLFSTTIIGGRGWIAVAIHMQSSGGISLPN